MTGQDNSFVDETIINRIANLCGYGHNFDEVRDACRDLTFLQIKLAFPAAKMLNNDRRSSNV